MSRHQLPLELPALVSNGETQSHAGEQPFGVKPLVGPGGWGFSPSKSRHWWVGAGRLHYGVSATLCVCPPLRHGWGPHRSSPPRCAVAHSMLVLVNKLFLPTLAPLCQLRPAGPCRVGTRGSTSPPCRPSLLAGLLWSPPSPQEEPCLGLILYMFLAVVIVHFLLLFLLLEAPPIQPACPHGWGGSWFALRWGDREGAWGGQEAAGNQLT